MKILDFTNRKIRPMSFGKNTIMVMAHIPKIIVFENSDELWNFENVWEEINEYVKEYNLYNKYQDFYTASWYVDPFEEEVFMFEDGEEGRNITIKDMSYESNENFGDKMEIYFGILNSKDTYIEPNILKLHCELIRLMLKTKEINNKFKEEAIDMFKTILQIWEEDLEVFNANKNQFFKIEIIE